MFTTHLSRRATRRVTRARESGEPPTRTSTTPISSG